MHKFKVGDNIIIKYSKCYGIKGIIVEYKGINVSCEDVWWIKRLDGKKFEFTSTSFGSRRNNELENSFWEGWLKLDKNTNKEIKKFGIVIFMENICK